jgi:hypothetical protein
MMIVTSGRHLDASLTTRGKDRVDCLLTARSAPAFLTLPESSCLPCAARVTLEHARSLPSFGSATARLAQDTAAWPSTAVSRRISTRRSVSRILDTTVCLTGRAGREGMREEEQNSIRLLLLGRGVVLLELSLG